jgi:hypothetical protein
MTVAKVVKCYSIPDDVDINYKCQQCETNQSVRLRSDIKEYKAYCEVCETINELEIIVCPECNSSGFVKENQQSIYNSLPYHCQKCAVCF